MNIEVQIINAFAYQGKGGNPAGVVLNADHLSDDEKLKIAAKTGVSETAFVSKSSIADFKLDFFTPNRRIAHCGHATIATFSYLAQLGMLPTKHSSKETVDGRREILIDGELSFMQQQAPQYTTPTEQRQLILDSLHLTEDDLIEDVPVQVVNTGNSFLMVPVKSLDILKKIQPDLKMVHAISDTLELIGFYPFTFETFDPQHDASTRMFAPRYAIDEEAGTGMAAGPLACYLYQRMGVRKNRILIEQGWFMRPPSPSQIIVDLEISEHTIQGLMAGGKGIVSKKKQITL